MAAFRAYEQEGGATAKQISQATLIGKRTIQRRIKELTPARLTKALLKNGFQLSLSESQKMKEFEDEQNSERDQQ
jgi:transcriptional antiterminator